MNTPSKNTLGVGLLKFVSLVVFLSFIVALVIAIGDAHSSENATGRSRTPTPSNTELVSVEMELISGSMICATYRLPIERGHFYTDTRKSAYGTFYKVDNRPRLLRYAVIYAREVDHCDYTHRGVHRP